MQINFKDKKSDIRTQIYKIDVSINIRTITNKKENIPDNI